MKNLIVFDGNSLVAGYPENSTATGPNVTFPHGTDFPSMTMQLLGSGWTGFNVGVSARQLDATPGDTHITPPGSTQIEDFERNVASKIFEAKRNGASRMFVVNGGEPGNLLYFAILGAHGESADALEAAYRALQKYSRLVRKAGALFVHTTLPARVIAGASNLNLSSDAAKINDLVRACWRKDNLCDALADVALDDRMTNTEDERYYVDGTHLTAQGYQVMAEYVAHAVLKLAPFAASS